MTESFPELSKIPSLQHAFVRRIPEAGDMDTDKNAAIASLTPYHTTVAEDLGFSWARVATAEQIHGKEITIVDSLETIPAMAPGVDGLITNLKGIALGIYVADCGAVSIVDPKRHVVALLHSGRRGSELGITGRAIELMANQFESKPSDLTVHLGPCIRPPAYDIDFAALIRSDALNAGVAEDRYFDCGTCTAANVDRYYSYRVEKGSTGRMLSLLGWQ